MKMRLIVAAGLLSLALPSAASAQTYGNTRFPFCLQNYAPIQYIECRYTSYPQCQESASGRGAMCMANPYFTPGEPPARRRRRS